MSEQKAIKADLADRMTEKSVAVKWNMHPSAVAKVKSGDLYRAAPWPNGEIGEMPKCYRKSKGRYDNDQTDSGIRDIRDLDFSMFPPESLELDWAKRKMRFRDYATMEELLADWPRVMDEWICQNMDWAIVMNEAFDKEKARVAQYKLEQEERDRWHEENPLTEEEIAEKQRKRDHEERLRKLGPLVYMDLHNRNKGVNLPSLMESINFQREPSSEGYWFLEIFIDWLIVEGEFALVEEVKELWNTENWTDPIPDWRIKQIEQKHGLE